MPTSLTWTLVAPSTPPPEDDGLGTYSAEAYTRQLIGLLPPGPAWEFEDDSVFANTLRAIADEFARVDARARQLIEEWDPSTADETIEDWERFVQLPDERITSISAVLAERRLAVVQKLTGRGGQKPQFFIDLAADCGYVIALHNYVAEGDFLRVGFRCSDRVFGTSYAYAMRIDVSPPAGAALSHADFEAVMNHATHSHITLVFNYL